VFVVVLVGTVALPVGVEILTLGKGVVPLIDEAHKPLDCSVNPELQAVHCVELMHVEQFAGH